MQKWRMITRLQIDVSVGSNKIQSQTINITKDELISSELQVLLIDSVNIINIDPAIERLYNLEIFSITNHKLQTLPLESLGKLTKLKIFDISNGYDLNIDITPNSMCNWDSLLYFSISQTRIKSIPDCVSNLKFLKRAEMQQCFYLKSIPKQLFQLPNIITVIAAWSNIQNISFDNNDIWSDSLESVYLQQASSSNTFVNNLIKAANVSTSASQICSFDSTTSENKLSNTTKKFLTYFGACSNECSGSTYYGCGPWNLGNGICDSSCFSEACSWDGGDCSQLCLCNYNQSDNYNYNYTICDDQECNNAKCFNDFGQCNSNINFTNDWVTCHNVNESFAIEIPKILSNGSYGGKCKLGWINDEWCDGNCYQSLSNIDDILTHEICFNEINDCTACTDSCFVAWQFIYAFAFSNTNTDIITLVQVCNRWQFLKGYFTYDNCTQAFNTWNINDDDHISFFEAIYLLGQWFGISQKKAAQINCSLCLSDPSNYV